MKRLYLSIQIANYTTFLLLDLLEKQVYISNLLKFFSICLCLFFIWALGGDEIFTVAIALTTVSDFFLLFTDLICLGMVCFCVVQVIYQYILVKDKKKIIRYVIVGCVGISVVLLFLNCYTSLFIDEVLTISFLYFAILVSNVYEAWKQKKRCNDRIHQFLFIGFLLFLLCDIHVALFNAARYIPNLSSSKGVLVTRIIAFFMWFYYLPAQMLLSYVGVMKKGKTKK